MIIRKEIPQDLPAITHINQEAFARDAEAKLVVKLRQNGKITLSLVAVLEEQLVGHILFTPMTITAAAGDITPVVGLGPVAVLPEYQRQGIGSHLCQTGIKMCREAGHQAVLVLGHPAYYPRFGFQQADHFGITCTYDVPAEAFMALELQDGALSQVSGVAAYEPEFDGV